MNRRRRGLFVFGAAGIAALALVVSCTFPDPTFIADGTLPGDETASASETSTPGADSGADVLIDVSNDVQGVLVDGGDPDALITKDDSGKVDVTGCTTCDCDEDGFRDTTKAGCGGPDAGPHDCDDKDSRTRPSSGFRTIAAEAPQNGNWNCVNGVERLFEPNISCKSVATGSACDSTSGFEDDPACGEGGSLVQCKTMGGVLGLLATCEATNRGLATQACK